MSKNLNGEWVGIINLAALKDIVISDGKLTAPLDHNYAKRFQNFNPPIKRVVFIDNNRIVGHGAVTRSWTHVCDHNGESMMVFDIEPIKTMPRSLTKIQIAVLGAHLEEHAQTLKGITGVMPLAPEMSALFPLPERREPVLLGMYSESWLRSERQAIHEDDSIQVEEKLRLLQALDACGQHADDVWALHTTLCGEGAQDFLPYPIVPWEYCSKEQLLDPHNWVLLPSVLASNFRMGLITFADEGYSILSKALLFDLHQFDVYHDFILYTLTDRQRDYMKFHREEIFDSWRTNPPWLSC